MIEDPATPSGEARGRERFALPRRLSRGGTEVGWRRLVALVAVVGGAALLLAAWKGRIEVAQTSLTGLVAGAYYALGAVGLTLVYGVLRLINFAHGDMLTFGAYFAFLLNVHYGWAFAVAVLAAIAATAALAVGFELTLFGPMRARGAALPQLLLITVGLAFLLRNGIQLIAGVEARSFDIDVLSSVSFWDVYIGRVQLIDLLVGVGVLVGVGLMLRFTKLGKQMRAVSDDFSLAEVSGIDTQRVAIATWILGGGLAALAGVLYASALGVMTPNLGFSLILALFAAAVLGGVGNAYGALAGGFVIGLSQEWSTLVFDARWKPAVGFALLILTLLVWPQGIFGRRRTI